MIINSKDLAATLCDCRQYKKLIKGIDSEHNFLSLRHGSKGEKDVSFGGEVVTDTWQFY